MLLGTVAANSFDATALFEYGSAAGSYTAIVAVVPVTIGAEAVVSATLPIPATNSYHYRLVATHQIGTRWCADRLLVILPGGPIPPTVSLTAIAFQVFAPG